MEEQHEQESTAVQAEVSSFYKKTFDKLVPGEDWLPYRGTKWFEPENEDSLIEFADAEAESMAEAKRKNRQTSVDLSNGITIEFKGKGNDRVKRMYEQLVEKLFELKVNGIDTSEIVNELS